MSNSTGGHTDRPTDRRTKHNQHLARTLKERWNLGIPMFRAIKSVFHLGVLAFSTYLLETASVSPTLVMAFATVLIAGPEGVEAILARADRIKNQGRDRGRDREQDEDRGRRLNRKD